MQKKLPVTINAAPEWDIDTVLVCDVLNHSHLMSNLLVIFHSGRRSVKVRIGVFPGWRTRIPVPLKSAEGDTLFLRRTPGRFKTTVEGANISIGDIDKIEITAPDEQIQLFSVENVSVRQGMPEQYIMPETPLVDKCHQWRGRNWPGKADSLAAVKRELDAELGELNPEKPDGLSQYGGWQKRQFERRGWFYSYNDGRRWWLVDPDGYGFWSAGVDCVRSVIDVNIDGIESVFEMDLPGMSIAPALWHKAALKRPMFNALGHNFERMYGKDWFRVWLELTRKRLMKTRFNTVANWSDLKVVNGFCMPYVFTMNGFPSTTETIFRDFPDVYSEEYQEDSRRFAEQLQAIKDDRCVIGYFMTNEPKWAFVEGFDIARQILRTAQPSATRDALISFLAERYGEVSALNHSWQTALRSWDDFRGPLQLERYERSAEDTSEFTRMAVEKYIAHPASACRAVDPNHMNLGLRWAWLHSDYQLAGHQYLDAFSINCYLLCPDREQIERINRLTGKPVLIGEYHIGALDRGLPSGGIKNVGTMAESAAAYRYYVEQAAALPGLVGCHYFQWNDQHVMGRFDGENMQIGLCDITGRMYPQMQEGCYDAHANLYEVVAGRRDPYDVVPNAVNIGTLTA